MADTNVPLTGVAYVCRLEHEYMHMHGLTVCMNCFALGFDRPMKRCNGCKLLDYCSKECQKAHWPKHKKFCNLAQGKGLKSAYLASYPQDEAFQMIIDSYRMRVETDHIHRNEDHGIYYPGNWEEGIVWVKGGVIEDFQRYLDLAERSGILPQWWDFVARMDCLRTAVDNDQSIWTQIDQNNLILRYGGDTSIHPALSILGELVVGYEGKGAPTDNEWFFKFQEYLDLHPEERQRLIKDSVAAVRASYLAHGKELPEALKEGATNTSAAS